MNWAPKRWAILLICVVVMTFIVILGRINSGNAYARTSWEYKVVQQGDRVPSGMEDPERGLNQLGMDGWELVHYIRNIRSPNSRGRGFSSGPNDHSKLRQLV